MFLLIALLAVTVSVLTWLILNKLEAREAERELKAWQDKANAYANVPPCKCSFSKFPLTK